MLYILKKGIGILDSFIAELQKESVEIPSQALRTTKMNGALSRIRFLLSLLNITNSYSPPPTRLYLNQLWILSPIL